MVNPGLGSNEVQVLRYNTSLLFCVLCNVTKYFFTEVLFTCTSLLFQVLFYFVTKYCDRKVVLEPVGDLGTITVTKWLCPRISGAVFPVFGCAPGSRS